MAGLLSIKRYRYDKVYSSESVIIEYGYGLIIVSSSTIGKTSVAAKQANSITVITDQPNLKIESISEYSFKVTNMSSQNISMNINLFGYIN